MIKKTKFWNNVRESFAWFGTISTGSMAGVDSMGYANIPENWMMISACIALGGAFVSHMTKVWFVDEDNDGIVDLFEK